MNLPLLALLPWLAAAVLACLPTASNRLAAWLAGATALAVTALVLASGPAVFGGAVERWAVPWLPALGLQFGFRLDGLAWLFALLIGASARWWCCTRPGTWTRTMCTAPRRASSPT